MTGRREGIGFEKDTEQRRVQSPLPFERHCFKTLTSSDELDRREREREQAPSWVTLSWHFGSQRRGESFHFNSRSFLIRFHE